MTGDAHGHLPEDHAGEAERPGHARLLARFAVEVTPLRTSRDFRRLWFGTGIPAIGSQITVVAIPFQVYDLTGSTLLVGLLGLTAAVTLLTVPLWAGAVATRSTGAACCSCRTRR